MGKEQLLTALVDSSQPARCSCMKFLFIKQCDNGITVKCVTVSLFIWRTRLEWAFGWATVTSCVTFTSV